MARVTDPDVDIFDREAVFIDRVLEPMRLRIPTLKVVLEHITTRQGAEYIGNAGGDIAATITTHHLIINRNAILVGGIRPHYYCLPIAKRETHRLATPRGRDLRQSAVFPGHGFSPASGDRQGERLRLRRDLYLHQHAVLSGACVRGRRRARQA